MTGSPYLTAYFFLRSHNRDTHAYTPQALTLMKLNPSSLSATYTHRKETSRQRQCFLRHRWDGLRRLEGCILGRGRQQCFALLPGRCLVGSSFLYLLFFCLGEGGDRWWRGVVILDGMGNTSYIFLFITIIITAVVHMQCWEQTFSQLICIKTHVSADPYINISRQI